MTSWLAALRIARREARRAKGRSALVLAMITLPVLALAFAAVTYDMFQLTPAEEATRKLGTAEAQLRWEYAGPVQQDAEGQGSIPEADAQTRTTPATEAEMLGVLPAGSRVIRSADGLIEMRTAAGIGTLNAQALDVGDPMVSGIVALLSGRAPANDGEVALTGKAVDRLGAGIGDTIRPAEGSTSWTVVGIVEFPASLNETVVFRPGALPGANPATLTWLVDAPAPVTWDQVLRLNQYGILVASRAVLLDPPPPAQTPFPYDGLETDIQVVTVGVLVAGLALLEVVLLAGPAFAVGARRRQRDLALVAANGGTPAHLRRIVLADGVVLGALGAVLGIAVGVLAAFAARPLLETYLWHERAGGYRVFPLALAGIAGIAVVTGVLAALVPAFTAARINLVAALTGRRGVVRSRKRWLFAGLVVTALGAATTTYGAWQVSSDLILAGLIVGELGLVLCTPALVGLIARLGRALPLAPRIALRDTARNRASAAPAISAVMAAVAGSVAIGVYLTAGEARQNAQYIPALPTGYVGIVIQNNGPDDRDDPPPATDRVMAAARAHLPVDRIVELGQVTCPNSAKADAWCGVGAQMPEDRQCPLYLLQREPTREEQRQARRDPRCQTEVSGWTYGSSIGDVVGGRDAVAAITGTSGDDLARAGAVLDAGGVVVYDERLIVDGKVTLMVTEGATNEDPGESRTITVPGYAMTTGTEPMGAIYSAAAVAAAGLPTRSAGVAVATTRMPTQAEEDALNAAMRDIDGRLSVSVERGPRGQEDPTALILAMVAGVITLGAASIATGLAAADGRADLSTLAAVGASPRVRRLLSLSQSGVIAGLGSTLGVVAGLGAAFAVLFAFNQAAVDRWPPEAPYPMNVPWTNLAVVLVVPLVAMLAAGLLTRSRLPIEQRRLT